MATFLRSLIRKAIDVLRIKYEVYRLYQLDLAALTAMPVNTLPEAYQIGPVTESEVRNAKSQVIAEQAWYGGTDAFGFAVFRDGQPVCVQWVWHGDRYREQRGFWPLAANEAKSVQLVTALAEQGGGLATALKQYSAWQLKQLGFTMLYSRIWWNNTPSIRVSEKSGWKLNCRITQVRIGESHSTLRLVVRSRLQSKAYPALRRISVSIVRPVAK